MISSFSSATEKRTLQILPKVFACTLGLVMFLIHMVAALLWLMEFNAKLAEECLSGDFAICDSLLKPKAFIEMYLAAKDATAFFAKAFVMGAAGFACLQLCWWSVSQSHNSSSC